MQCTECGANVAVPLSLKTVSCTRCGDAYFVIDATMRRMYPMLHMLPVDHPLPCDGYPLSKWMMPHTRPIIAGNYHVRFRHTEPEVLIAHWDAVCFRAPNRQRVDMRNFMTWRGLLA